MWVLGVRTPISTRQLNALFSFCVSSSGVSRTWKFNLCLSFFFPVILLFYLKGLHGGLSCGHIALPSAAYYKEIWLNQLSEVVKLITLVVVLSWFFNNCFTLLLDALELLILQRWLSPVPLSDNMLFSAFCYTIYFKGCSNFSCCGQFMPYFLVSSAGIIVAFFCIYFISQLWFYDLGPGVVRNMFSVNHLDLILPLFFPICLRKGPFLYLYNLRCLC